MQPECSPMPMKTSRPTMQVFGNNGTLTVDVQTGIVLWLDVSVADDAEIYSVIQRFNVQEWRGFYGDDPTDVVEDILAIGFWTLDGIYEPPEDDYRDWRGGNQ